MATLIKSTCVEKRGRDGFDALNLDLYKDARSSSEYLNDKATGELFYSNPNSIIVSTNQSNRNTLVSNYIKQYLFDRELVDYKLYYYPIKPFQITLPDITNQVYNANTIYNTGDIVVMIGTDNLYEQFTCLANGVTGEFNPDLWGNKSVVMNNITLDEDIELEITKKDFKNKRILFYTDILHTYKYEARHQVNEMTIKPSTRPFRATFTDKDLISPSVYTTEFTNLNMINLDGHIVINDDDVVDEKIVMNDLKVACVNDPSHPEFVVGLYIAIVEDPKYAQ